MRNHRLDLLLFAAGTLAALSYGVSLVADGAAADAARSAIIFFAAAAWVLAVLIAVRIVRAKTSGGRSA